MSVALMRELLKARKSDRAKSLARLGEKKPGDIIMTNTCNECGEIVEWTAAKAIRMVEEHGIFRPSKFCLKCRKAKERKPLTYKPFGDLHKLLTPE